MEAHRFMPKISGQHSRDFCLPVIPCAVTECPCNVAGKCEVPSAIKIDASDRCEQFKKMKERKRYE